jgi:uncharacterized protein (UPF0147 family)
MTELNPTQQGILTGVVLERMYTLGALNKTVSDLEAVLNDENNPEAVRTLASSSLVVLTTVVAHFAARSSEPEDILEEVQKYSEASVVETSADDTASAQKED